MGSKKNRKVKQEIENQEIVKIEDIDEPKENLKRKLCDQPTNQDVIVISDELIVPSKVKKKKKKNKDIESSSNELETEVIENGISDEIVKPQKFKNGILKVEVKDEEDVELPYVDHIKLETETSPVNEEIMTKNEITMPQKDLMELISRIEVSLPPKDTLSYKCRLDKVNWNDVAFSIYTIEDCKETWGLLQKKIRRYRILKELLEDAKEYVMNPPGNLNKKKNMHPGMPQKPPSGYQLFYKKKKPALLLKMPGMEIGEISRQISQMFKKLAPGKREKYERIAAELKVKYDQELEEFYSNHPEIERPEKKKKDELKPKKPQTPFLMYFNHQLRKKGIVDTDVQAKNTLKEECKLLWKQLSMKKKVSWITKAEQDLIRYEEEVKEHIGKNPNFLPINVKHILSKEEIALKEKFSGKPDKPPTSAYSLFSRNLLQSDEIKKINVKDRMNFIANEWKNCSEEDKNNYKSKVFELMEQYKIDYDKYLNSLPEEKRQLELQKNISKKRTKSPSAEAPPKKKAAVKGKVEKMKEPQTPPISAFRYFANVKSLDDKVAKKEWRKLSENQRQQYEKKLVEIKREYILEFEKFLNSLSKAELEEYSKTKQELKFNSEDFVDETTTTSSCSDDDSE